MGKKRYLNNFITKWIKSDLPEDCSTVLLLGVTRIPTSPIPPRRPCNSIPNQTSESSKPIRCNSFKKRSAPVRRNSSKRWRDAQASPPQCTPITNVPDTDTFDESVAKITNAPKTASSHDNRSGGAAVMDRSVDSIGTCSLDIDASITIPDSSDKSSTGTLRSASILSSAPTPHLPSYINLACTVNGYSTTTNYDPQRVIKSRDASPNRWDFSNLTPTYTIQNNLLSPPNLVPLPTEIDPNMTDQTLTQHTQFHSTTKTIESFCSKESRFSSSFLTKDSVDACYENKHLSKNKSIHFKSEIVTNGEKQSFESVLSRQDDKETKSFIQQRVERLYGPGALAQGFFVIKKQSKRFSESDKEYSRNSINYHSKSMNEELLLDTSDIDDTSDTKQSSNRVLPVLRHLRPEFRAQLPIVNQRKSVEGPKPKLFDQKVVKTNGISNAQAVEMPKIVIEESANQLTEDSSEKNGHYFLKILDIETERLLKLADHAENELSLNEDLSEEIVGMIHSAAGKARLLVSQKMQQFKGLCTNNITQVEGEAYPTTNEDLQGFWDMVMLQVDQVDNLFKEIEKLKSNNWKQELTEKKVVNGNVTKTKKTISKNQNLANIEARKQREMERKRLLEERRKAMKNKSKQDSNIEIFVPESS